MFIYAGQLMNEEEAGIGVALSLTVNTESERDGGKRDPRLRSLFKSTSPLSIQYIIFSTYNTFDLVTRFSISKIQLNLLFFNWLIAKDRN